MAALRYGVVGCGRVFQAYHLPSVLNRADYAIVAVCDLEVARAREVGRDLPGDVLVTDDVDEFFTVGRPDVVAVCTPNDMHLRPMLAALAAGTPVLCEKPLAARIDDARRIAAVAADAPLAGVNLPYRFHELAPAFVEALPDGECEFTVTFSTAGMRVWRPATAWYDDAARAGGGAVLDLGPHALDLIVAMLGWPRVVGCRVDRPAVEERAVVDLVSPRGPVRLCIDRACRRMRFAVCARQGDQVVELDIRRGTVRTARGVVAATGRRPELEGIERFLDAARGQGGAVVPLADALRLQERIGEMYALAVPDPAVAG